MRVQNCSSIGDLKVIETLISRFKAGHRKQVKQKREKKTAVEKHRRYLNKSDKGNYRKMFNQ